jgi:CheY-like chemotaxis protein
VYSEVGHGTVFKIYLPRAGQTRDVETALRPEPVTLEGAETLLIVEDHRHARSVTAQILKRHGYDVIEAASGVEALRMAGRRSRIDLLLTDAVMPGMSGRALADQFLRDRPQTAVLYMSGYTQTGVEQRALVDPSQAFIQKPFAPQALLEAVRSALDRRTPQPELGGDAGGATLRRPSASRTRRPAPRSVPP